MLASWIVWVIGSIVLHELAHGWAAIREGDDTPIATGHMTWNPLVHMGGLSLLMFALVGIAWGAMPVNPSRFRGRWSDVIVSLAGPAMNLLLATVAVVLAALWATYARAVGDPLFTNVFAFFFTGAFLNVGLAAFNLLPVPPLDGARILAGLSPAFARLVSHPNAAMISLVAMVVLFTQGGGVIFGMAEAAAGWGVRTVTALLPGGGP
ncbi:MAG: site-2 protease family protein [Planctomycetota bacterium]|nr:site-2 protease family protein [Planctomycetota bacterium]